MEKHYEKLKDVKYTEVFHKLKEQFEKNEYAPPTPEQAPETTALGFTDTTRLRLRKRYIEERKEEAWFDADDAEDEDYNPKNDTEGVPLPSLQEFKERTKNVVGQTGKTKSLVPGRVLSKNKKYHWLIMVKKKQNIFILSLKLQL